MITLHENTTRWVEFQLGPFPGKAHQFAGTWYATVYLNDEMRDRIGEGSGVRLLDAVSAASVEVLKLRSLFLHMGDGAHVALLDEVSRLATERPHLRCEP